MTKRLDEKRRRRGGLRRWILLAYLVALAASHVYERISPRDDSPPDPEHVVQIAAMADDGPVSGQGTDLSFLKWGVAVKDRPPVILLHGSPGGASNFTTLGPILAQRGDKVFAIDLPGFGRTSGATPSLSIRAHARAVLAFMDALSLERAHIVGWSLGGGVALEMAALEPDRLATITLMASVGLQSTEGSGGYYLEHAKYALGMAAFAGLPEVLPHFGYLRGGGGMYRSMRNFWDTDQRPLRGIMEELTIPTLVFHGRKDVLIADWAAHAHHDIIPSSRLVMLDANHFMPFFRDQANLTARYLQGHFRRHDAPGMPALTGEEILAPPRVAVLGRVGMFVEELVRTLPWWALVVVFALTGQIAPRLTLVVCALLVGRMQLDVFVAILGCVGAGAWRQRPGLSIKRWFGLISRTSLLMIVLMIGAAISVERAYGLAGILGAIAQVIVLVLAVRVLSLVPLLYSWKGHRRLIAMFSRARHHEYWPIWLMYLLIMPELARLSIKHRGMFVFTACNPAIGCGGGVVGESKHKIMAGLLHAGARALHAVLIDVGSDAGRTAIEFIRDRPELGGLPVVLKPDAGERGDSVVIARTEQDVESYFADAKGAVVVQRFHPGPHECGILWRRDASGSGTSGGPVGNVYSITRKEFPEVVGDGVSSIERLVYAHPRYVRQADVILGAMGPDVRRVPDTGERVALSEIGNHVWGALFRDGADLITPELEHVIDEISAAFPSPDGGGLDVGRYDIRYESDEQLRRGEGFAIVELNGVTGESTNIYDPDKSLAWALGVMRRHWAIMYELGASRRKAGVRPLGIVGLVRVLITSR